MNDTPGVVPAPEGGLWVWIPEGWPLRRVTPEAPEGYLDWLRARGPEWSKLSVSHAPSGWGFVALYGHSPRESSRPTASFSDLRALTIDSEVNNAWRLCHGLADGHDGLTVDRLGDYLLAQAPRSMAARDRKMVESLGRQVQAVGVYWKRLDRRVRDVAQVDASPRLVLGEPPEGELEIIENGLRYGIRFDEGYSVGLFLDQRENRRRVLRGFVAPQWERAAATDSSPTFLNGFAYTCGFSVAAAAGGMRTTSVDLSKRYLQWGRENMRRNGLNPDEHDFIYGDVFDWLARFRRQGRRFDWVALDPPTFSKSKKTGVFRVERDLERLVGLGLDLLPSGGTLLFSCNTQRLGASSFYRRIHQAHGAALSRLYFVGQPLDFPVTPRAPGHLKCLWMRKK